MPRRFWILAAVWTVLVVASSPLLIEILDGAGWTVVLPGLSASLSEAVMVLAIVGIGLAVLWWRQRPR
jgi:hypothetical protein